MMRFIGKNRLIGMNSGGGSVREYGNFSLLLPVQRMKKKCFSTVECLATVVKSGGARGRIGEKRARRSDWLLALCLGVVN